MRFSFFKLVLLSVIFTFIWASCGSPEPSIEGKWYYAKWNLAGQDVDLVGLGNPVIDFKENNVFTVSYGVQENTEKWHLANDTLVMEYKDGNSQRFLINKMGNDTIELLGKSGDFDSRMLLVRVKK